jgi:tetratricopeptide (TPR) repeat protein
MLVKKGRRRDMKKLIVLSLIAFALSLAGNSEILAGNIACGKEDAVCQEFAVLSEAGKFQTIIAKVNPKQVYSAAAQRLIGNAYLIAAGKEGNTPQQEEQFCLKALSYGATSAYLSLYFSHVDIDNEKAIGYLREYVKTKPEHAAPYVLLGEADYKKGKFKNAKEYLRQASKVTLIASGDLDWLLFKTSYLSGDYSLASATLDSSFSNGKTMSDLKTLVASDPRFTDMGKRAEFQKLLKI